MRSLLRWSNNKCAISLLLEPRDMWIGIYWTREYSEWPNDGLCFHHWYIALLPCLPIHIKRVRQMYPHLKEGAENERLRAELERYRENVHNKLASERDYYQHLAEQRYHLHEQLFAALPTVDPQAGGDEQIRQAMVEITGLRQRLAEAERLLRDSRNALLNHHYDYHSGTSILRTEMNRIDAFLATPPAPASEPTCEWRMDSDGFYQSGCGHAWEFSLYGPTENGVRFCMYCGKVLIEASEPGEGEEV